MGKATVVYVIGLMIILAVSLININHFGFESNEAFVRYYTASQVHDIAQAGANIGAHKLLKTMAIPPNFGVSFFGGRDSVFFASMSPIGGFDPTYPWVRMTSVSTIGGTGIWEQRTQDTVIAVFRHDGFAEYGWFTESETNGYMNPDGTTNPTWTGQSDWKITGDSIYGKAHTNGQFNLYGSPYFDDRVTGWLPPNLAGSGSPIFNAGSQWNIFKTRPSTANLQSTLVSYANAGGVVYDGGGVRDLSLSFNGANVRVQTLQNSVVQFDSVLAVSAYTANGSVVVVNGDLHVKGTYNGELTLAAFSGTSGAGTNKGNVWIAGSIEAADNPATNPLSDDIMGIVAGRMVYIDQALAMGDPNSVVTIQAAVYVDRGEITADHFFSIPYSGRVSLYGSITQKTSGSLGVFDMGTGLPTNGFYYTVRHDPRFKLKGPKMFPAASSYVLYSWWEN